jgi:SNF2 family DNA or RNA helicase
MEQIVKELIDNKHPVVIFTQFRDIQACAKKRIEAMGIYCHQLNGDVDPDDRVQVVRDWTAMAKGGTASVIICMYQVAGVGLNMTVASHMIRLDKLYVPKLNEQAEDRIHRIGADKTKPVQIYDMFCRNTVDTRIEKILKTKSDIFDTLVATDTGSSWTKAIIAAALEEDDE